MHTPDFHAVDLALHLLHVGLPNVGVQRCLGLLARGSADAWVVDDVMKEKLALWMERHVRHAFVSWIFFSQSIICCSASIMAWRMWALSSADAAMASSSATDSRSSACRPISVVRDNTVRGYLELLREVTVDERVLLLELLMHLCRVTRA